MMSLTLDQKHYALILRGSTASPTIPVMTTKNSASRFSTTSSISIEVAERDANLDAEWFWLIAERYKVGLAPG